MDGIIKAEWAPLKKLVIHRPGIEMFLGLLEPYGSLYERAFSRSEAVREHEQFEHILKHEFKVDVMLLGDLIMEAAEKNPKVRSELVYAARESIAYKGSRKDIDLAMREFEDNSKYLDNMHFLNIMLLRPLIDLETEKGTRNVRLNIAERQPISNLYFMRDQQMTTDRGIVLTRMAKPARRREPEITKFLWEHVIKVPVAMEVKGPGTIEGGEFLPMGKFCLVGIGDRTNQKAIDQLLAGGLGFEEVGVVHQPRHPLVHGDIPDPMVNMHLDTYFNVAAKDVVVGCDDLLTRARVDIYHKEDEGVYEKEGRKVSLHDYIIEKGFHIINITTLEQLSYASNFLCIEDRRILAIEVERGVRHVLANLANAAKSDPKRYGKLFDRARMDYENLKNDGQFFPHKREIYQHGIDCYPVILKNLTGGYGGAHCMTCALARG